MAKNLFLPIMGTEEKVQRLGNSTGSVYFTTDTRKIYLDVNDSKLPMGGNVGLFYGKMKPTGFIADDQKEFEFTVNDLIREEDDLVLIPNVNDLILNDDGCFYKVLSVDGETFNTEKLTIAGTGGGSVSGPSTEDSLSSFNVGKVAFSRTSILQGGSCILQFAVKVTDDVGDYVTDNIGTYEIWINGNPAIKNVQLKGIASGSEKDNLSNFSPEEINTIDIAPYLPVSQSITLGLKCMDVNGVQRLNRGLSKVSVSSMELTWDYDNKSVNHWTLDKDYMTLSWSVSGANLTKNTYISIDDSSYYHLIGSGQKDDYTADLKFSDYGLTHGSHTIKMWAEADLGGGETVPTPPIYKNIVVAEENNNNTIISICLFNKELTQYNTVAIPVYIYNKNNIAGTYTVSLIEESVLKTKWLNVPNSGADESKSTWYYTPLHEGDAITLTVSAGGASKSVVVTVKGLGITLEEKSGYAFKFKANEFSSNTDVQNWTTPNGQYKTEFSSNFDWINGGIGSEHDDEAGDRQFVAVKAGTEMEITYPMWNINAPGRGKHLKVIFKTTNCRDYDATALTCKVDKKIVYVDKSEELFLLTEVETQLDYAESVRIDVNNQLEMMNIQTDILNAQSKESVNKFKGKYVQFEDIEGNVGIYQCAVIYPDPTNTNDFYVAWYKTDVRDSFNGLEVKAQNATIKTNNTSVSTQYCEDTYIELEVEFTAASSGKRYIKMWIDGVPCGYTIYDPESDLFQLTDPTIKIGSPDCDVQIYLIKLYETELSIPDHMANFYADAPNAEEMLRRYNRNNIMNKSNDKEIDMFELAKQNPDCLVHHYIVPEMPTTKKTKKYPCSYYQYQGSSTNKYRAEGVMIKVQGTSSEKYVVSAANLDTDFNYTDDGNVPSGILDGSTGERLDGWAMSENAIPIEFACTKVNVASCENVNNYLNQEWYNKFQPYQSVLRCKNPHARDTMQFTPGVLFITDKNKVTNKADGVGDNVFKDTPGYIDNPYAKMYSLGQMGNSKDNIEVLHDTSNPQECCVEVADNQKTQQCMINDEYNYADIGAEEKIFEFRYPEEGATQEMIDGWNDFVSWMAHSNPSPKYEKHENVTTEREYKDFAINKKTFDKITTFIMNDEETDFIETGYNPDITTYYTLTDHKYGYTGLKLPEEKTYGSKKFVGYRAENQKRPDGITLWQKDYSPLIAGCEVKSYANTYTHDTYEYRMAKMLDECEDHLVMDSVLYHYLFIERHCMIDNVAKNTFWSTEDCQHWNMIKDYDNDTSDGNDNQGKLTRTYGMEPTDRFNANETVFNASRSVWFNFCHGLYEALEYMYEKLSNRKLTLDDGTRASVWDYDAYLKLANKIQSAIPERCWIEDYQRKYFRPNEVYGDTMYNDMLEGGQKKYQRKQFETYQDIYLNSKYEMLDDDKFTFRPTGEGLLNAAIPVEVYSDCYVYSNTGSNVKKERVKRNTVVGINCPEDNLQNATMYIHPGSNITKIGTMEKPLGVFAPTQMSFAQGKKLRSVIYGHEDQYVENTGLEGEISFAGATMLEKAYLSGINQADEATRLDLSSCTSLLELDATKSTFTAITLPNNAPTLTVKLEQPTALVASNLTKLQHFSIADYSRLRTVRLENMDTTLPNFSKNIIATAMEFVSGNNIADVIQYKITNAVWSLNSANEMNNTNILLLDKMLDSNYSLPVMGDDNSTRLPYSAAFTGDLTISSAAYNGSEPLKVYNRYVTDTAFANLDMNFESANAKLYDVIIYDGDNQPHWQKKTTRNTVVDNTFLSTGPNGQFNAEEIYKSPNDEFEYVFLNIWDVKFADGTTTQINDAQPTGITITQDTYITPRFSASKRSYTITLKQKNPITNAEQILLTGNFEYGTPFATILASGGDKLIPYVDDPDDTLDLYEGYDFKGYSASENSKIILDESKYSVIGEATFYAVFEHTKNINKITHPEWFKVSQIRLDGFNSKQETDNKFKTPGVVIAPITHNLGGKVTIPNKITHEGTTYNVIGIANFSKHISGNNYEGSKVTHIFAHSEETSTLHGVSSYCFRNTSSLKYFDFENFPIRFIEDNSFNGCAELNVSTLGKYVYSIEGSAFLGAFADSVSEINIPGSVKMLANYALANNMSSVAKNRTLNIGSENDRSSLTLRWSNNSGDITQQAFRQNQNAFFNTINFWSTQYVGPTDIIAVGTDMTVASWFVTSDLSGNPNIVLATGGSVFVNNIKL